MTHGATFDWYTTHIENPQALENPFRSATPTHLEISDFEAARGILPAPHWDGHDAALACYWKVWEIAWTRLKNPTPENGFVSAYMDTGFNGNLFMWDSAFITLFGRYARRAFSFQGTLDNFYRKQHRDGFICREIRQSDGTDCFERFDPPATGPEVLSWAEWVYFSETGDLERVRRVYPALCAYRAWMRRYRTWPDGMYWATGWACGMDNQPRLGAHRGGIVGDGPMEWWSHDHMTWVDACFQAALSARVLAQMARVLGRDGEAAGLEAEHRQLLEAINAQLWNDQIGFYVDRYRDGSLSAVKSIGAYWALLAGTVPAERLERLVAHLEQPNEFKRVHRVPTLSADHRDYNPRGGYWRGGVWAPTNDMLLRGLRAHGCDDLAFEIALNHHAAVVKVFEETGTLWENYAPDSLEPGSTAAPEFVGWTGLPPTAVLLEFIFGLRAEPMRDTLVWDVRLLEDHGVKRYPFGADGVLDLHCAARGDALEEPQVTVHSSHALTVDLRWAGGQRTLRVSGDA
jgi:hypothetical protein